MKWTILAFGAMLTAASSASLGVALWGNQREQAGFNRGYETRELERLRAMETTLERLRDADTSTGDPCADERFILESLGRLPDPEGDCGEAGP